MFDYDQFINLEYFFYKIYQLLSFVWNFIFGVFFGGDLAGLWASYSGYIKILLGIIVILFIAGIIYSLTRIYEIRKEEKQKFNKIPVVIDEKPFINEQWEVVLKHVGSTNPSDWRLAIIEADNMLDSMVKKLGYEGEDLGERLKAVEPADFNSLESAWEAHKVRNQIVHEGVGFQVTKSDAERVINLYERVFREFEYI